MNKVSFIYLFFVVIFSSCSDDNSKQEEKDTSSVPDNYQLLEGRWQDTRDTSHAVIFHNQLWLDLYNNDTVSKNNIVLFSDFPDRGGVETKSGSYIRLEESPGNFYFLIIKDLDSSRLNLDFVSADMEYSLYRINH